MGSAKFEATNQSDPLEDFCSDVILCKFLQEDFSSSAYCTDMLKSHSLSQLLSSVDKGIDRLNAEISGNVAASYGELIEDATWNEHVLDSFDDYKQSLTSLATDASALQRRYDSWCAAIEQQCRSLSHLHSACHVLRRVTRLQCLSRRLTTQLHTPAGDIAKAARTINEIDELDLSDLSALSVYRREMDRIKEARRVITDRADQMLITCLSNSNQLQLLMALQVYQCLGTVATTVTGCVDNSVSLVAAACRAVFAPAQQVRDGVTSDTSLASVTSSESSLFSNLRTTVWPAVEALVSTVHCQLGRIVFLQRVLYKKRELFSDLKELCGVHRLFLERVVRTIVDCFDDGRLNNPRTRLVFETDYPKLLRHFSEIVSRMTLSVKNSTVPAHVDTVSSVCNELRESLLSLENAYLSRSLNRLFDPINVVFADQSLPSESDVSALVTTLSSEASVVSFDAILSEKVRANISKAVLLYCTRCETLIDTSPEAVQLSGGRTQAQERNVTVVNLLSALESRVTACRFGAQSTSATTAAGATAAAATTAAGAAAAAAVVAVVTGESANTAGDVIATALAAIADTRHNCLQPLLDAIGETLHQHIWSMHTCDYSSNEDLEGGEISASEAMTKLHSFITVTVVQLLLGVKSDQFLRKIKLQLAVNIVDQFLRSASSIRPVGTAGALRLAADISQLQMALQSLFDNLAEMGSTYRALRAFKPLLFQTGEQMASCAALGSLLPYSVALHLLLGRCDVTADLPQLTADQRVLATADERQQLQLFRQLLKQYCERVQRRGLTEYVPLYPAMIKLLEKALTEH